MGRDAGCELGRIEARHLGAVEIGRHRRSADDLPDRVPGVRVDRRGQGHVGDGLVVAVGLGQLLQHVRGAGRVVRGVQDEQVAVLRVRPTHHPAGLVGGDLRPELHGVIGPGPSGRDQARAGRRAGHVEPAVIGVPPRTGRPDRQLVDLGRVGAVEPVLVQLVRAGHEVTAVLVRRRAVGRVLDRRRAERHRARRAQRDLLVALTALDLGVGDPARLADPVGVVALRITAGPWRDTVPGRADLGPGLAVAGLQGRVSADGGDVEARVAADFVPVVEDDRRAALDHGGRRIGLAGHGLLHGEAARPTVGRAGLDRVVDREGRRTPVGGERVGARPQHHPADRLHRTEVHGHPHRRAAHVGRGVGLRRVAVRRRVLRVGDPVGEVPGAPDAGFDGLRSGHRLVAGEVNAAVRSEHLQLGELDVAAGRIAGRWETQLGDVQPDVARRHGAEVDGDRAGGDRLRRGRQGGDLSRAGLGQRRGIPDLAGRAHDRHGAHDGRRRRLDVALPVRVGRPTGRGRWRSVGGGRQRNGHDGDEPHCGAAPTKTVAGASHDDPRTLGHARFKRFNDRRFYRPG